MDAAVAILILLVEVGFHTLGNERFRHLFKAEAGKAFAFVEALSQEFDRFHQIIVLAVSG